MKFSLAELSAISVKCGLPSTAPRARQLEALKYFYKEEVSRFSLNSGSILSMDLGLVNLAACEVEVLEPSDTSMSIYKILNWNKFDLNLPDIYNPAKYAENVKKFVKNDLLKSFQGETIFIERQRHRSGSNSAVLEIIMRLAILEAQLHCYLSEGFKTIPINPGAVAKFFDLPTGKDKKSAAVVLVKNLLKSNQIVMGNASLETFFLSQKKQDDLADSLLQAIASIEFRKNCNEFMKKIQPEEEFQEISLII